jgi:uncharacterized protein
VLALVRTISPRIDPALQKFLSEGTGDPAKKRVIAALGEGGDPAAGNLLVGSFKSFSPALQTAAFDVLVTRREWALPFLGAIETNEVSLSTLGPANIARLRTHASAEVAARANTVFSTLLKPSADKDALVAKFAPAVAKRGNTEKGKELFVANCANCHKFGDLGTQLGPVLTGMGVHGADTLLTHILDPNRRVDIGYESWNIETKDGEMHSGIIAQENAARVVLQMAGQQLEIPKATIKSRIDTRRSLMPEGFEALGEEGLRDLLTYLVGEGSRFRVLDLSPAFTADTRRGLYHSQEALGDTLPFAKHGLVEVEGVPFNIVDPAKSPLGGNVIVLRGGPPESFAGNLPRRVEVPVGFSAAKFHFLGGVAGWGGSANPDGPLAMRVTIQFEEGKEHQVDLRQGDVFVDYVAPIDAPSSKLAQGVVHGKQVRWFTIRVPSKALVKKLVLESPATYVAPTTVAITADLNDTPIPGEPVVQLASLSPIVAASTPARRVDVAAPLQWGEGTKVLVVGGGSSHDFRKWFDTADVATMKASGKCSIHYTESAATAARALPDVDVLVMSTNQRGFDTPEFRSALLKFAERGKGIVLLHPALWYNWPWPEYNRSFVGGGSRAHDAIGEFNVNILEEHPVTRGLPKSFKITDELYHVNIDSAGGPVEILATTSTAKVTKKEHPSIWLVNHPKARIVCIAPGHDGRVHELPEYKTLLANSVKWAAGGN